MATSQPSVVTIDEQVFSLDKDLSSIKKALDTHGIILLKGMSQLESTLKTEADQYSAISREIVLNKVQIQSALSSQTNILQAVKRVLSLIGDTEYRITFYQQYQFSPRNNQFLQDSRWMDFAEYEGTAGISTYHLGGNSTVRYSMTIANAGDYGRLDQLRTTKTFLARGGDVYVLIPLFIFYIGLQVSYIVSPWLARSNPHPVHEPHQAIVKVSYLRNDFKISGGKTPGQLRQRIKSLSPDELVEDGDILLWKLS